MITAVVPVSPIKSHPDTAILAETLDSFRFHHPTAEIILTFDGVRPEQECRRGEYEEHIRRVLWLADKKWRNVCPFVFDTHMHQTGMLRAVFNEIRTPLLLYVEQDTPIVTDEPIDWQLIYNSIECGEANVVRLYHEGVIPEPHRHLMHGGASWPAADGGKITMLRTSQWSQRPHVASTAYYRRILDAHFTTNAKCFLEDVLHGVLQNAWRQDGMAGWQQHRLYLYHPDNGNAKRSYHTDGRAGEPKWDESQVF